MNLTKKIAAFSLTTTGLRVSGMVMIAAGLAGQLIQLGSGTVGMTNTEVFEAMQADSALLNTVTLALVFQALEACAVPLFAFLLVEGATHTSDFGKYFLRVLGLAALSQLPYNLLMTGSILAMSGLNPVFALVMSMAMLYFFRRYPGKKGSHIALKAIAIVGVFLWSNMLGVSHGACCVIMTAVLWALRGKQNLQMVVGILTLMCCSIFSLYYVAAPISFLILHFYEGEKGAENRLVNYLAYPAILLVFCAVRLFL